MKKWIRRIYIGLFILLILVIAGVNFGMGLIRFSDADAKEYFEERGFEGKIENVVVNDRSVKVVSDLPQESDSILLVFVHGAPGTWDAFKEFVTDDELAKRARIVAYDRPGYGGSGATDMPGIQEQAEILKEIIKSYGLKKTVLVGHSYGGPIVGLVGLDTTVKTDAVIMIAPLIDPVSEPLHWYAYFSYWNLTSWLLPSELVVAGSEKFAHSSELKKMENQWRQADCTFVHVHGLKDGLAPGQENIDFSKKNIPEENLELHIYDEKGHLLIWTDYKLMRDIIIRTLDAL